MNMYHSLDDIPKRAVVNVHRPVEPLKQRVAYFERRSYI